MTPEQLAAAYGSEIPDLIAPRLAVLFCGINPGLWSGATGRHFARPGNRFWPALYRAGFTPRLLRAEEQGELLSYGCGITNLVARATARADELTRAELSAGAERLAELVREYQPRCVAVVGITAYRAAFGRPRAVIGRQDERVAGALLWALPNPSGLNAHYQVEALAREFALLRRALLDAGG